MRIQSNCPHSISQHDFVSRAEKLPEIDIHLTPPPKSPHFSPTSPRSPLRVIKPLPRRSFPETSDAVDISLNQSQRKVDIDRYLRFMKMVRLYLCLNSVLLQFMASNTPPTWSSNDNYSKDT